MEWIYKAVCSEGKEALDNWRQPHEIALDAMYLDTDGISASTLWKYLDDNRTANFDKKILRKFLLEEQGYICCYCGQRIDMNTTVIEHLLDKGTHRRLTYDYSNLLASCNGGKMKIHQVKAAETLSDIASLYACSPADLEELHESIPEKTHIKKLKRKADIKNLRVGDRLFIQLGDNATRHCDAAKGKVDIRLLPTTSFRIENKFSYDLAKGEILGKNKGAKINIKVLGLNQNNLLKQRRVEASEQQEQQLLQLFNELKAMGQLAKFKLLLKKLRLSTFEKNAEGEKKTFPFLRRFIIDNY